MSEQHTTLKPDSYIACRNIWKLYGAAPAKYLASMQGEIPDTEEIGRAGYIAAVKNVSLNVAKGEMLVVMGLSGSGKSTLLRCLSRLSDLTGGEVIVDGQNLGQFSEKDLIHLRRSKMGMVFQNFALLPHRTVLHNVAFPLEMRGQDPHTRRERAMEMIKLVGLQGREDYFPRELSGGQQQRVGIARSLAIEPDIWFLDEPFSALDPLIRREMQDEFLRLQAMLGKTIIFITHDFDEALRLADRIAIMKDGVVEQVGSPEDIVLNPQTPYVAKFIEDIDKARVVHVRFLTQTFNDSQLQGDAVLADTTLLNLARQIVEDTREVIPVIDAQGTLCGGMRRAAALEILFGSRV